MTVVTESTAAGTGNKLENSAIPKHVQSTIEKQVAKIYIDGTYVDAKSGKTYDNICPLNAKPIGKVAEGDSADIDRAVKAAREAFDNGPWGTMSARKRAILINKFADELEANAAELSTLESIDNGKSYEVASNVDIPHVIDCFRYFAGHADKISGSTIDTGDGALCSTYKEPVGVVGAIIPWNFPLAMFAWKVAPALATGCTMVVKCAEQTPLTALKAAELASRAGIPKGVLNVVPGFGPTAGAALCKHKDVDKLAFTGSTEVGKLVAKEAAEGLKRVSLELGGKSPLIIAEDADVDVAVEVAHRGLFFNHGQCCCASSRVYVHENIYDSFMSRIVDSAKNIQVSNPFEKGCYQGPQVDEEQFTKVMRYITLGKEAGASLMCGGDRLGDAGYYVQPTIFGEVKDNMEIARDEIFGPVMSCMKYTDLDDVLRRANDSEFGLAAGIVSTNLNTVNKAKKKLRAGTVWVNTWNTFDPACPFGGYKQSGIHRDKGEACLDNYLEIKTVIMPSAV